MKVLLTGASGFIGGAIAAEITRRGHEVTALSRAEANNLNVARVIQVDLQDASTTLGALADIRCDVVVHAAAKMAGVSQNKLGSDYSVNEKITQNLLTALSGYPPTFFLCASSIDVYAPTTELIDETAIIAPETSYAASKYATENLCQVWADAREVPLGIGRLTQVFGPGDRTGKLIPAALAAIKADKPIKLFGEGEDQRDYLFIDDAARLVADWTERRVATKLNLATGISRSINEVLECMRTIDPSRIRVERLPREKPRKDCRFDIEKLRSNLAPICTTDFANALRTTYELLH